MVIFFFFFTILSMGFIHLRLLFCCLFTQILHKKQKFLFVPSVICPVFKLSIAFCIRSYFLVVDNELSKANVLS